MQISAADIVNAKIELHRRGKCPLGAKDIPPVLIPLFEGPADIRAAHGGRGGGKSWAFTKMLATRGAILDAMKVSGVILCIREFMNSLDDSSLQDLKNAIMNDWWLSHVYEVGEKFIRTRSGRIKFIFSGTSVNLSSIKSKSRILICFAEEAEYIGADAWEKLIPTIREEGSELWLIYNPETNRTWVHKNVRLSDDPMIKCVEINWKDNPWFTSKMDRDRRRAQENDPDNYDHIWEGGMKTVTKGAYFSKVIAQAKEEGRIGRVAADPMMTIRLFIDIGGTGARADNFVIWAVQFIGREVRVIDHYEVQGQDAAAHMTWLRSRKYTPDRAQVWLPHDGGTHDRVINVSYESAFRDAGYDVTVIPNQGRGAASARIEAVRRLFPSIWINEDTTTGGMEALAAYHEKHNEDRSIGLGPEHDWSSHSADAFGLMAIAYEEPQVEREEPRHVVHSGHGGWA